MFDPFTATGLGTTQTLSTASLNLIGAAAVRASNSVGYFLPPNLGGFYGDIMHFRGENAQAGAVTDDDGTGTSVRVGWRNKSFNAAVSFARISYAQTATAGDVNVANIGASYDLGPVQVMGHIVRDVADATTERRGTGGLIGVNVPVGAGLIRAAYSVYKVEQGALEPRTRKLAVAYVHNLSKRTAAYATYARVSNSGGANASLGGSVTAANAGSSGFEVGVRHSF